MPTMRAYLTRVVRTTLCIGLTFGAVAGVVAAITAERSYTYTDASSRIEHRFAASTEEIVVRFDGP